LRVFEQKRNHRDTEARRFSEKKKSVSTLRVVSVFNLNTSADYKTNLYPILHDGNVEVEEQAHFYAGESQVCQQLCFMDGSNGIDAF
jgi:hypothetical protein